MKTTNTTSGFTLLEITIVLLVIGLIIGGILVGQDLIKTAELRSTIQQLEKYQSTINAFKGKYGSLPGDLSIKAAADFGMYTISSANPGTSAAAGSQGMGDGNGKLEGASAGSVRLNGENVAFWRHLSDTDFIEGDYGTALTTGAALGSATTINTIENYLPPAKMGRHNYITVYSLTGMNYYAVGGFGTVATTGIYGISIGNNTNNIPPMDAFTIDAKIDDGKPGSGVVVALDISAGTFNTTYTSGCANSTTNTYVAATRSNQCSLRIRFN